jgi:parallel beta-helix repeat protein
VHTSGVASIAIRLRAGSNKNTVKGNVLQADNAYAVDIQSSDKNELSGNTLISPNGYLYQGRLSLQNGGIAVDSSSNVFAVENNWGSSAGNGAGIGEATAFFQVDPNTGAAMSAIPLLQGGVDVGFGFGALEILPNGRVLALRGDCSENPCLFEVDPLSGEVSDLGIDLPPGAEGALNGLDALDDSNLLATTNQGNLISIDLVAGEMSLIGDENVENVGWTGVAVHPSSGDVYTVSRRRDEDSNTAHLYRININDGQIIAHIGDTGIQAISGIDFAPIGTLYGNYNLETIDINTGLATTVGNFGADPLEPRPKKNHLKNNLLQNSFGSLRFPGKIVLPSVEQIDLSADRISITDNEVFVESAELPFLDEPARIVLSNLPGTYRNLLIDPGDDGSFGPCKSSKCKFVSFTGGPLVFDVKGFTTYSSEENADPSLYFVTSTLHAEINLLLSGSGLSKATKKNLRSAGKRIAKAIGFLHKEKVKKSFSEIAKTAKYLRKAIDILPSASVLLDRLIAAAKNEAQNAIDSANLAMGDDRLISSARAHIDDAEDLLDLDKPDKAIAAYGLAWRDASKAEK